MSRRAGQRARLPSFRALAAKIGALLLGSLLVLASLRAGQTYWWCVPMQEASFEPCCGHDEEEDAAADRGVRGSTVERECCVSTTIGELPVGAASSAIEGLLLAPVAIVTVPLAVAPLAIAPAPRPLRAVFTPRRHGPTRDGPGLSARARCIDLQVFRC